MHAPSILYLAVAAAVSVSATECNFSGGFALRQPGSCSSDSNAPVLCPGGSSYRCCPRGTFCKTRDGNAYCCPTDDDCYQDLNNVPRCAKPDWSLWAITGFQFSDAWCCNTASYGVFISAYPGNGGGVECSPFGTVLGTHAATASPITNLASSCTTSSAQVTSSSESRASQTSPSRAAQTSSSSSSGTDVSSSSSSSLGAGAIAGIVVGCVAGAVLLLVGTWWVLRHRAANKHGGSTAGKGAADQQAYEPVHMAASVPISEMGESNARRYELPT